MAIHSYTDMHTTHSIQPLHSASQKLRIVVQMSKETAFFLEKQENLSLLLLHAWVQAQKCTQAISITLGQNQRSIIAGL